MFFEGMSDPCLPPLMATPYLNTTDALVVDIALDDAYFPLAPLRENDESEQLLVKTSCGLKHNIFTVSKDIFVEEYSLEETHLEEL